MPLSLAVNANNHITTAPFTYDAAGNLTTDAAGTYTWNAEGELKAAGGVTYTYDGDGRRVQKSNGKIYWYGGGEVIEESDASGNMQESYVFFGGKRIANRAVSSGAISYYAEDFIGSSRVITTSAGATCYDADFYPYGAESNVTNTCPQNYKWTGKERDAETGNDDFDARYYSSVYGRFLSADWSAVPAAVPYANLTNPQTLNLYAIVRDNPESFADLDGHEPPIQQGVIDGDENAKNAQAQKAQQSQTKDQKVDQGPDLQQQAVQATAQRVQEAKDKQNGPPVGSPEYVAAVSSKVNAEMVAGKQLIGIVAGVEAVGAGTVVAASGTAEGVVANARAIGPAIQQTMVRVGTIIDTTVPGGAVGATQFVKGALQPTSAPPTIAGRLGSKQPISRIDS